MNELTESNVKSEALTVEQQAEAVQITNNEQYENAATILKTIKESRQKFIDFFAPAKKAAAAAHKAICANETACTDPCDKAESIIKGKMLTYTKQLEAQRKAAEEETRKAQQAEADKLLEQAAQAEQQGDSMAASMAMAQADMVSQITTKVEVAKPKVAGVSTRSKTVVKIVDDAKVPAFVNGFCIRTVDEKAILTLHKLNPGLTIPGISFEQEKTLSVR
jgi:ribosomal protein S12